MMPRAAPKPDRCRALELLAAAFHDGATEALMLAHGFTVDRMVELVRARPGRPRQPSASSPEIAC